MNHQTHVSCFYRSRVTVDVGKFVKLAVNHELVKLIGGEGASNCEPGFDDYDKCIYDTLFNLTLAELDCTVPWLPGDRCEAHTEHNEQAISFFSPSVTGHMFVRMKKTDRQHSKYTKKTEGTKWMSAQTLVITPMSTLAHWSLETEKKLTRFLS